MLSTPLDPPNVFLLDVVPAPAVAACDLERCLLLQTRDFAPSSRPSLPPALFSHRVLRREGGLAWEIVFEGIDPPEDCGVTSVSLSQAIVDEARARLAGTGEITSATAYVDLLGPPPDRGFGRIGAYAYGEDELPGWEMYAADAGTAEAGGVLPAEIREEIEAVRAAVPVEPELKQQGRGHMYTGNRDKAHLAYLEGYLDTRAAKATVGDRRKIFAFLAFQAREGSTAAINTYDNQIVTWGTGWGGLGWLGKVMEKAVTVEALRDALGHAGVRYRTRNTYDVVDLCAGTIVTGREPALQAIRGSVPLLYLLINIARGRDTRDAATEAQLLTFMEGSANIAGADAIATQALFNLVVHLSHWLPGYVVGSLAWAVPQLGGAPSVERDRKLAVLVGRYFYGKARRSGASPAWPQFQLYFHHMKADGLDCLDDPFIQADGPPTDDPFASAPLAAPAAASATLGAACLKSPSLAGQPDLAGVASGKGALRRGAQGAGVKALQQALIALGGDVPGGADGAFGPGLERAVTAFQSGHRLAADGVVGQATLLAIDAALGRQAAS